MTEKSNGDNSRERLTVRDKRPKTKEEAEELAAELLDLKNFTKWLLEDNQLEIRELNIERLELEYNGKEPNPRIVDKETEVKQRQDQVKKELVDISKVINGLKDKWNINLSDIVPVGPWQLASDTNEGVDLNYTELLERIKSIETLLTHDISK